MDIPDLFSDDVELCGQHIRLVSHRDGPDLNSNPHLNPALTLLKSWWGSAVVERKGDELFMRTTEAFPLFLFESCFSSGTTKVERGKVY